MSHEGGRITARWPRRFRPNPEGLVLRALHFCREFVLKACPWRQSPEAECRVHGLGVELEEALLARAAGSILAGVLPRERTAVWRRRVPPMHGFSRRLLLRRPC
jgi:hypothetical protein